MSEMSRFCHCRLIDVKSVQLQQIEHLLSRYVMNLDCVVAAEVAEAGLAFFQPPQSCDH
jgi:hypothetical protein